MVKMRTRECNKPVPESGGLNCTGAKVEQYPCASAAECQCKGLLISFSSKCTLNEEM